MRPFLAIARTTMLEALREKVLYGLAVFGIAAVLLSIVLSTITLGHRVRIVTDLSLTGLLISGTLLAVILGANSVARDIDRRITLPVLAKPVSRTSYVLGRFLGIVHVVALNFAFMATFATLVVALNSPEDGFPYGWGSYAVTLFLVFLRIVLVTGIAVTLSGFVSTTIAQVAATGIAVAGHFTSELKFFLSKDQGPAGRALAEVIYRTLPDLGALDSLYELIHGQPIATQYFLLSALYAILYTGGALTIGCWALSNRELA